MGISFLITSSLYCCIIQSVLFSLQQDLSHVFSMNSWSNQTSNDSFDICLSWGFRNTPYMFDLMKFWLSYLRLKTIDSISKTDCSSITCSLEIEPCLLFTLNISAKTSSNQTPPSCFGILITNRFQKCHWESNLTKNSWRKHRKYLVANWTMHTIFHTYLQNNKHYSVKLRKILLKTLYIL